MNQKIAFLFPGQGAQSVGMCRGLYEQYAIFKDTIEEIQDYIYRDLWTIIAEGPDRDLKKTVNCQLALFAVSLATMRTVLFEKPHLKPAFCAGLSLGEFSALCASGILDVREGTDLIEKRAHLMQRACELQPGKMVAVVGLVKEQVDQVLCQLEEGQVATIANYNAALQIVVSGNTKGIQRFCHLAQHSGARRLIELDVAGAFHSPLMRPAAEGFKPYMDTARLEHSDIKVCSNVTGNIVGYSDDFRTLLVKQITEPVLWYPTIQALCAQGVTTFIEMGPGRVLQGLNRRNTTTAQTFSVETVEDITALP